MNIHPTLSATAQNSFPLPTPTPSSAPQTLKTKVSNLLHQIYNGIHNHLPHFNIPKAIVESKPTKCCTAFINTLLAPCRSPDIKPEKVVGIDPLLYKKTLANGLNFYVRKNDYPFPNKAYLRLVLRVGMLNETPEEKGIAHLIEHVSQIETANFAKDEVLHYLSQKGIHWARDNNAHTAAEETVYKLDIPLDDPETLEKALFILSEVASKASLSDDVINNEREIIIDELTQKRTVWNRYANAKRALKCAGSPYATLVDRDAEIENIKTCSKETIQNFYNRWYQPHNMAVIAVGDFDAKNTGDLIEKHFGKIPSPKVPPSEHKYTLDVHPGNHFLCFDDPDATHSLVEIQLQLPQISKLSGDSLNEKDIQYGLVTLFIEDLVKSRLDDLCQEKNAPFIQAGFSKGETIPDWPSSNFHAIAAEGCIPTAFRQLLLEIKRLKTHGILPGEFERIKKGLEADFDHQASMQGKTNPSVFLKFYQAHFTKNMAAPDYEKFREMKQEVLKKLTIDDINKKIKIFLEDDNQFIFTAQPQKKGLEPVTEEILKREIATAEATETPPPTEANYDMPLLKQMPKAGKISNIKYHENADITEYLLENGMKVLFKPTTFCNDSVSMYAFSRYGLRDADISKLAAAKFSRDFFDACGMGDYDLKTLQKILAGKKISFESEIEDYTTSFNASSVPKDLETTFQLFHLLLTNPGYDRESFDRALKESQEDLKNMQNDPGIIFANTLNMENSQNHPYFTPVTFDDLNSIDYETCKDFHKKLHSNPADFTLTIVGNAQQSKIRELAENYLAGIPKTAERRTDFNYSSIDFPSGIIRKDVIAGEEDSNCLVALTFPTPPIYEFGERCLSTWCCKLLEQRLNIVLRFAMGKSYSQRCNFINKVVPGSHQASVAKAMIMLTCDPANKDILEKELMAQIRDLQANGPTEVEINDYKINNAKSYANTLKTNVGWLQAIATNAMWDREQDNFDRFEKELENLTKESAREQFKKMFSFDNYSVISLLPKEKAE